MYEISYKNIKYYVKLMSFATGFYPGEAEE